MESLTMTPPPATAGTALMVLPQKPVFDGYDRTEVDDDGGQRAEWGLRRYVGQVAVGLGVGVESTCCEAAEPANAYVALTRRLCRAPDRDVALFWDGVRGWALGIETGSGEDVLVLAYLGGEQLLAQPDTVVAFAETMLAGRNAGQPGPPAPTEQGALDSRLADYARSGVDEPDSGSVSSLTGHAAARRVLVG